MSSKTTKEDPKRLGDSTEFQLHKSQQTIMSGDVKGVLDYTERRLLQFLKSATDDQQKAFYETLLSEYVSGKIAVAWRGGRPIWIKITKA